MAAVDLIDSVLVWDRANSVWLRVDVTLPVQDSEEGANSGAGQMSAVGCRVVCCWQWAVQCHSGQGECFPALGPQQLGKSVGFSSYGESHTRRYSGWEPLGKEQSRSHGGGAVSGWRLAASQLGLQHQHSSPRSMPKLGQAAPCVGLWESPLRTRDLNVLTVLSARAGVTSSLVQGAAQLLLLAEEVLGGLPEYTHPGTPMSSLAARTVCACEHRVSQFLRQLRLVPAIQAASCSWQKCQCLKRINTHLSMALDAGARNP